MIYNWLYIILSSFFFLFLFLFFNFSFKREMLHKITYERVAVATSIQKSFFFVTNCMHRCHPTIKVLESSQ